MPDGWHVPRIWPGETCAIVATGPSLTQAQVDRLRGHCPVMVICEAWRMAPWADWLHACEFSELDTGAPGPYSFAGIKTTLDPTGARDGVHLLQHTGHTGFDDDPRYVRTGGSSGYQGICLAVHAGVRRVLLLGFDCKIGVKGELHCHGEIPGVRHRPHASTFPQWARYMRTVAPALTKRGVAVVNCTPGSALDCFPKGNLDEALCAEVSAAA